MAYRYLEDVATADAAFEATGETLEELFRSSVDAALGVMVASPESVAPRIRKSFAAEEDSLDLLLLQILQEIVYYKDAEHLFLRCDSAHIEKSGECWKLSAKLAGEPIDTIQHEMLADVKAVTLHLLAVERAASGWTARAVLDI